MSIVPRNIIVALWVVCGCAKPECPKGATRAGGRCEYPNPETDVFEVATETSKIRLLKGSSVSLPFVVRRQGAAKVASSLEVIGLPSGILVDKVGIPVNQENGSLTFRSDSSAMYGGPKTVQLRLVSEDGKWENQKDLSLVVAGSPGTIDTSFGADGQVEINATNLKSVSVRGVVRQTDGKLLVHGYGHVAGQSASVAFAVQLLADGEIDSSFGEKGVLTQVPGLTDSIFLGAIPQSSGDYLMRAVGFSSTDYIRTLLKIDSKGKYIDDFGDQGRVAVPGGDMWVLPRTGGSNGFIFAQPTVIKAFTERGDVDVNFGNAGSIPNADGARPYFDSEGGFFKGLSDPSAFIIDHYKKDGTPDVNWGQNGRVRISLVDPQKNGAVTDIVIQPDGKIVAACFFQVTSWKDPKGVVIRLNPNGTLDSSFGQAGVVAFGTSNTRAELHRVFLQNDYKVLVFGFEWINGREFNYFVARYNVDGSLDTSFANSGLLVSASLDTDGTLFDTETERIYLLVPAGRDRPRWKLIRYWL